MKLHSLGPSFYDEAEGAYDLLFKSEIFLYPESVSEAERHQKHGALEELEENSEDDLLPAATTTVTGADVAPSSLPQILYLAYKNYGQFQLDRLKARLSRIEQQIRPDHQVARSSGIFDTVSFSLDRFTKALDQDDTDLELWRQVARIAGLLGSRRIARFCLESVLDTDEAVFDSYVEPLGLDESFAMAQLNPVLRSLDDQLSESQLNAKSHTHRRLMGQLTRNLDPFPYLPPNAVSPPASSNARPAKEEVIIVPLRTWASCGKAILYRVNQEAQGLASSDPGAGYSFVIPSNNSASVYPPPVRQMPNRETFTDPDRPSFVRSPTEDQAEYVDALMEVSTGDGPAEGKEDKVVDLNGSVLKQAVDKVDQIR